MTAARVLVTRPADQSEGLLRALRDAGLDPVLVPAISVAIEPAGSALDDAARGLSGYDWAVVASPNGARAILEAAQRVRTELWSPHWGAIGWATSEILERDGIEGAFRPSRSNRHALATELPIGSGDRILVIRGDLAGPGLADALRRRVAEVDDVVGYRTIEAPPASLPLLRGALADGPFDGVVFTSGSTVRGLVTLAGTELDVTSIPAICIGPETADAAVLAGFRVLATAISQNATTLADTTAAALIRQPQEIH